MGCLGNFVPSRACSSQTSQRLLVLALGRATRPPGAWAVKGPFCFGVNNNLQLSPGGAVVGNREKCGEVPREVGHPGQLHRGPPALNLQSLLSSAVAPSFMHTYTYAHSHVCTSPPAHHEWAPPTHVRTLAWKTPDMVVPSF